MGAPGDTQTPSGSAGSIAFARVVGSLSESIDPYARSHQDSLSEEHELGGATEVGSRRSSKLGVHPSPKCSDSQGDIEEVPVQPGH